MQKKNRRKRLDVQEGSLDETVFRVTNLDATQIRHLIASSSATDVTL
jgi:hypothetical protein